MFFSIALVVPSGFSAGPALLVLGSFTLLHDRKRLKLSTQDCFVIIALAAYFIACCTMNVAHVALGREYDAPLRFLLAIPGLLLLLAYPPSAAAIWAGLAIGAIGSGTFASWQNLILAHTRAEGFTNPIQYGNISLLLGMLCLPGIKWARMQRHAAAWVTILLAGSILGILGSVFTGSRGSWIALPLSLLALVFQYRHTWNRRHVALGAAMVLLAFAVLYAVPRTAVKERLELAFGETSAYADEHNARTSVGARLEMWRAGLILIKERPVLGWGKQGYMNRVQTLIQEGKIDPIAAEHSHLHNEYIDAWVKRGIPGLLAVIIVFAVPLLLFLSRFPHLPKASQPFAMAGIMLCISYAAFGLTQAFLTHVNGVMLYSFTLIVLWTGMRAYETGDCTPIASFGSDRACHAS